MYKTMRNYTDMTCAENCRNRTTFKSTVIRKKFFISIINSLCQDMHFSGILVAPMIIFCITKVGENLSGYRMKKKVRSIGLL